MTQKQKWVSVLSANRRAIQITVGISLYAALTYFQFSIWWIIGIGSAIGIIWGKVFCRWMCPMGIIMEFMMKISPGTQLQGMYQYHKLGCPIAWVSGLLNKVSLYKIKLNKTTCKECGICDSACYMPSIDANKFSLYKPNLKNPAENFSCSKCLQCVAKCPNGSLSYKPIIGLKKSA